MRKTSNKKTQLLQCCHELFVQQGIKSVSIEDIVRACNMSKKRLYELFGNKEGLVRETLIDDCEKSEEVLLAVSERSENAIEEMTKVTEFFQNRFMNMNPVMIFDLMKYYHPIHRDVSQKKINAGQQFIEKNLQRGIEENLYRSEVNVDIVSKLWMAKIGLIREQEEFPAREYPIHLLIRTITDLHLRSIANEKGMAMINEYFKKEA